MPFDSSLSQIVIQTGSLTGFNQLTELGGGYLTATATREQPLCGNSEGWGPLSPFRYDFTPCFIDVWVSSVAAFGIVFGAGALWWLVRSKKPAEVLKDWHFWTKQVRYLSTVHFVQFHSDSIKTICFSRPSMFGRERKLSRLNGHCCH